jgi:hypothetical protein
MSNLIRLRLGEALSPSMLNDFDLLRQSTPVIEATFQSGGWLCGGFARHLLIGGSTENYLSGHRGSSGLVRSGDVDLFFPNVATASRVISSECAYANPSQGGFAKEAGGRWRRNHVKVQLVDHPDLVQPSIEDTLAHFDLVNCQVGIDGEYIYFPEDWKEIERMRLIRIAHNNTPFLGSRILKYLEHRGLEGLTQDSYEKLHGWFAYACNDFAEGGWSARHIAGVQGHVKKLREKGLVRREDLIFFLNKWKELIREKHYGRTFSYEVDWAANELGNGANN